MRGDEWGEAKGSREIKEAGAARAGGGVTNSVRKRE